MHIFPTCVSLCKRLKIKHIIMISKIILEYSVMLSDVNSFCGEVVLDSFNEIFRDEYNILDQMYKSKCMFRLFSMLKLFKTTSHQNLFPSDCITLYQRVSMQNLSVYGNAVLDCWTMTFRDENDIIYTKLYGKYLC